jgi:hypothetical protein
MNKLTIIYNLIAEKLIFEKYKVDASNFDKIKIKKQKLFNDIKIGLDNLRETQYLNDDEYALMLESVRSGLKQSRSFKQAIIPFMLAAIRTKKADTSID